MKRPAPASGLAHREDLGSASGASRERSTQTVGRHMAKPLTCEPGEHVDGVVARIAGAATANLSHLYVVDAERRLVGRVPLSRLLGSSPGARISEVMIDAPVRVGAEMDRERAASIAIERRVAEVAVVDDRDRLVGVVTAEVLMEVLRAEHLVDLHRLAGVRRDQQMARDAIEEPPLRRARHRLPWLLIGLAGSALATLVMARFEATLQATVAVAFFVPGIVYMADAIGTQTEAAAVRGLSLTHEPLSQLIGGELRAGFVMGLTLAALALPAVWLGSADLPLAIAVSGALLCAGCVATTIGLLLPWLLWRAGMDPAYGSGPLATVIQDVLSILIYLTIVTLIVR